MVSTPETGSAPAAMKAIALDTAAMDQLNSAEARALLDTIDDIRELQVGEIVDLPQIIAVGDQSAGKSSVLEAISRVRFPVKSGLCTRFATELVLRRSEQTRVSVSIKWDNETSGKPQQKQGEERQPRKWTSFDKDELHKMISDAEEKMGFKAASGNIKDFSKDTLCVEVTGPDVYPLTLVDLPGFFHAATEHQTLQGMRIVNELAEMYMKQKNSIVLTVVSASNQLANQTVLEVAKRHDPDRKRTLGIVTKPDLAVEGSSDEQDCLRLVKGHDKTHKLTLGWHVLRNRSQGEADINADERDANEELFFAKGAWSVIPRAQRGAEELRKKLSKVLLDHIRRNLPKLVSEIETSLREREERLERVGKKSRDTPDELRSYLVEISDRYQRLALDAVKGRYVDASFFGGLDDGDRRRKLRALLRNLNRAFGAALSSRGATYRILPSDGDISSLTDDADGTDGFPEFLQPFLDLYSRFPEPEPILEANLRQMLERLASTNAGTELPGAPNSDLVVRFFRQQAKPWSAIAERHLELVCKYAKAFVEQLMTHVVAGSNRSSSSPKGAGDDRTLAAIFDHVVDPFFDSKSNAINDKLAKLLKPYTEGFSVPLETEFCAAMSKRTVRRLAGRVADMMQEGSEHEDGKDSFEIRKKIERMVNGANGLRSNGEFGIESVIDMMETYYEMSLRTFIDNVVNLAVEYCLVCDIPSILNPRTVARMSDEEVRDLAQESEEVRKERARLRREAELLRQARKKCRPYCHRDPTVLPTNFPGLLAAGTRPASRAASVSPQRPTSQASIRVVDKAVDTPIRAAAITPTKTGTTTVKGSSAAAASATVAPATKPLSGGLFSGFAKPSQTGTNGTSPVPSFSIATPPSSGNSSGNFTTGAANLSGNSKPAGSGLFDNSPPGSNSRSTGLFSNSTGSKKPSGSGLFDNSPRGSNSPSYFLFGSSTKTNNSGPGDAPKFYYPGLEQVPCSRVASWLEPRYFTAPSYPDASQRENFHHISMVEKYRNFSPEELRWRDEVSFLNI